MVDGRRLWVRARTALGGAHLTFALAAHADGWQGCWVTAMASRGAGPTALVHAALIARGRRVL
eukprot:scaffold20989_cov108-Isochrysis_galbana.AAC.2